MQNHFEISFQQVEESEDSDTEVEAEGGWVECDQEDEGAEAACRRMEEEERRRSVDRQSSIVSSVSSLLWGLAQSPKSPKK